MAFEQLGRSRLLETIRSRRSRMCAAAVIRVLLTPRYGLSIRQAGAAFEAWVASIALQDGIQ